VYFDTAFASFHRGFYHVTLRNEQYLTQGDFLNIIQKSDFYCKTEKRQAPIMLSPITERRTDFCSLKHFSETEPRQRKDILDNPYPQRLQ
jgi:hypothetical protein